MDNKDILPFDLQIRQKIEQKMLISIIMLFMLITCLLCNKVVHTSDFALPNQY